MDAMDPKCIVSVVIYFTEKTTEVIYWEINFWCLLILRSLMYLNKSCFEFCLLKYDFPHLLICVIFVLLTCDYGLNVMRHVVLVYPTFGKGGAFCL